MIKADVTVHQLNSEHGLSYLNILKGMQGGVGVWGYLLERVNPAFLVLSRKGNYYALIVLDGPEWQEFEFEQLAKSIGEDMIVLSLEAIRESELEDQLNGR